MTNKKRTSFLLAAAVITGCFFMWSCENDIKEVQSLSQKNMGVEEARDIESYLSQGGKLKAKLTAPLMLRYQRDTPRVEFPKTLKVQFFNDSMVVESRLSAKYGNYLENANMVYLRDSVVVFNIKGDTLYCKDLYWDQQKGIYYTDKDVILHQPRQKIYGTGMTAAQNFSSFTIRNPHNSYINVPDSSFISE